MRFAFRTKPVGRPTFVHRRTEARLTAFGGDPNLLLVGLDLVARNRALHAVHDHLVVGLDAGRNHAQPVIDLPDRDSALLHHVVPINNEQVANIMSCG
jgi:hypothetical protein